MIILKNWWKLNVSKTVNLWIVTLFAYRYILFYILFWYLKQINLFKNGIIYKIWQIFKHFYNKFTQ